MDLGHPAVVAHDEAVEDFGEIAPRLLVEPSHDSEIDHRDRAVLADEHVSLVEIGMEEAVAERLDEEGLDHDPGESRHVVACRDQALAVHDMEAVNALQRQDAAARAVPVDCGDVIILVARHVLPELGRRGRLVAQIEFHLHPGLETRDDIDRP